MGSRECNATIPTKDTVYADDQPGVPSQVKGSEPATTEELSTSQEYADGMTTKLTEGNMVLPTKHPAHADFQPG